MRKFPEINLNPAERTLLLEMQKKISVIPEEDFAVGLFVNPKCPNKRCIMGHFFPKEWTSVQVIPETAETALLWKINVIFINDNAPGYEAFYRSTPKQRVMCYIEDVLADQ